MNYSCQAFLCNIYSSNISQNYNSRSASHSWIERDHHHHLRPLCNLHAKHRDCAEVQRSRLWAGHHIRPAHPRLPGQPEEGGGGAGQAQHHRPRLYHSVRSRQLYSSVLHLNKHSHSFYFSLTVFLLTLEIYILYIVFLTRQFIYF